MATADDLMNELLGSMESLEDRTLYAKTMVYGESGVGKTVELMQIAQLVTPPDKRILFVDSGEGWVSTVNHPGLTKRTSRMPFKSLTQIDTLLLAIQATKENPFSDIATIVVDEVSSIAMVDLDYVLNVRAIRDPSKDKDVATQPDMGAATERMRRTFGNMLAMDMNVLMASHIREDKDERTGRMITRPGMMPKLSTTIRQKLHDVVYMTATEVQQGNGQVIYNRNLQVLPTTGVVAKTRVGGIPVHNTPEVYNKALVEWMKGNRPDVKPADIVVEADEVVALVKSESDEFVGVQID